MNFSVEFPDETSSFSDDDTFEFLVGGVVKVSFTDAGVIHQTHYHAPGVWQSVIVSD
jgi:hypothetical protein